MHRKTLLLPWTLKGLLFPAILLLLSSLTLRSQVTPTYSYSAGTSSNSFPLNSTSSNMCQWLLTPSDFSPTVPTSGLLITTVYIRASNTRTSSSTFTNLTIKLNTNSTLTALTSGPWLTGLSTVYSATTTISAWTAGDWIPFTLPTNVFYNGTGNILIEITQSGYTGGMTVRQGTGTGNRRMYGNSGNSGSNGADGSRLNFGFDAIPAACSGQPSNPSITTAAINPANPVCIGSTKSITASNPNLGSGISLRWQTSASASGPWSNTSGGSGATTLTYTTPPVTGNRYYRLSVTCNNSNLKAYSPAYLVLVGAPQPGAISGSGNFCPGDSLTYSVPNVTGTTYAWTLPAGWLGASTTNSIRVKPGTGAGTISVIATSPCGTSIARSLAVVRGSAPAPPASISGSRYICSNTAQTYAVTAVNGATSYAWSLPPSWSGSSTTSSITAGNTLVSGTVAIRAVNGCGQSAATNLPVTVISALANPGPISGKDTVCSGGLQTYTIAPVNGATSYVWTLPSGWSGTTTGTSIQAFAGTVTDSIRVTAYVSCATSPVSAKRIQVVQTVTPAVSISAPAGVLCSGIPATFSATGTHGGTAPVYTWRVNGTPVSSGGASYTSNSLRSGDQVSVTMTTNAACATTKSVASQTITANVISSVTPGVSINTTPPTAICRGTEIRFNTTSTGGGAAPAYQWYVNNVPVAGATGTSYTTSTLADRDTISIGMSSNAVCATMGNVRSNKVGVHVVDSLLPDVQIAVSPSDYMRPGDLLRFEATETGGGATPDFQWQRNGVNIPFATEPVFTSSDLLPGDHITLRMYSYASCALTPLVYSNAIVLKNAALGVPAAVQPELQLYPNPSRGTLHLSGPALAAGRTLRLELLNSLGQRVLQSEHAGTGTSMKLELAVPETAANGVYQLRAAVRDPGGSETLIRTIPVSLQR